MHLLHLQSFGTNEIGANEKKLCGISENVSCNICVVLSGPTFEEFMAGPTVKNARPHCLSSRECRLTPSRRDGRVLRQH